MNSADKKFLLPALIVALVVIGVIAVLVYISTLSQPTELGPAEPLPEPTAIKLALSDLVLEQAQDTSTVSLSIEGELISGLRGGSIVVQAPQNLVQITQVIFNAAFELTNQDELALPSRQVELRFTDLSDDFKGALEKVHIANFVLKAVGKGSGKIIAKPHPQLGIEDTEENKLQVAQTESQITTTAPEAGQPPALAALSFFFQAQSAQPVSSSLTLRGNNLVFGAYNETKTLTLRLTGTLSSALAGGKVSLNLPAQIAEITALAFDSNFELTNLADLVLPASSLGLQFADLNQSLPVGNVDIVVANLTVRSKSSGSGSINLAIEKLEDINDRPITANAVGSAIEVNLPPTATIVSISPNPANLGATVTFTGSGSDPDGQISGYEWKDGNTVISTQANFSTSSLSGGAHIINFRVVDNKNLWSSPVSSTVTILSCPSLPNQAQAPKDLNNDGICEDASGNGSFGFGDLVVLFNNMNHITVNQLDRFFDCTGNGTFGFGDLVCFFKKL